MVALINGETDRISLFAQDAAGNGAVGASMVIAIQNQSSGFWFDGVGFQTTYMELAMTETEPTNLPGYYHYNFTSPLGNIRVHYFARSLTAGIAQGGWQGEAQFGRWVSDILTTRKHIRNKIQITGNRYRIFEDDKVTPFEDGDVTSDRREPDV